MKILVKVVGGIVVCVMLALVILSVTGLDPKVRRAGLWLRGDVQSFPADWTFADKNQTIMIETHPWYIIPHSVNIFFITDNGNLFLHADFDPGGTWPNGKSWTAAVARDPRVRLKLGNQVFDCKAYLVTDKAEGDSLFEVQRKKYPKSGYSNYRRRNDVFFLRVLPG
jgi:hypothetical protein